MGLSKDSAYGNSNNCLNNSPCATINSLNSGGGFISKLQNNVAFNWKTDTSNVHGIGANKYYFTFRFQDDNCNLPGATEVNLIVELSRSIQLSTYYNAHCLGDSTQVSVSGDTTNLLWSPANGVSNINAASPWFTQAVNTVYTVTDLNTGYKESVEIIVDTIVAPILGINNGILSVTNNGNWDTLIWKLNGAPIGNGFMPLTPTLSGSYYLDAVSGSCTASSAVYDTVFTNMVYLNPIVQLDFASNYLYNVSYGMNIKNFGSLDLKITEIILSSSFSGSAAAEYELKIYDEDLNTIFFADTAFVVDDNLVKFVGNFTLKTNHNYFIGLYSNGARIMNLYAPKNWPVTDQSNNIFVFNATQDFGKVQFPSTASSSFPYLHFILDGNISISENTVLRVFYIYPNPAKAEVKVSIKGDYVLLNTLGEQLDAIENHDAFKIIDLSPGVYYIQSKEYGTVRFVKI